MSAIQQALDTIEKLQRERNQWRANYMTVADAIAPDSASPEDLASVARRTRRERDEARGKLALIHEAYWLAVADMPHSDECAIATCDHEPEGGEPCTCECSCWRSAADKVGNVDEALKLCTRLRDADDLMEEAMHMLLNIDAHMASERVPVAEKLAKAIGHRWPPYEVCEACDEEHATKHDVDGVPLCEVCYDECVAETRALKRDG